MNEARPTLSVIIVTHDSREAVARSAPAVADQLRDDDELIVIDNASSDATADAIHALDLEASVTETGENPGFAAACNYAAREASGDLLCLLNPDAAPGEGWRDAIERPYVEGRDWTAWQALVTCEDGARVNTHGGVVHFTGIAWAGGAGEPAPPPAEAEALAGAGEPGFVSGACLVIPRAVYLEAGGLDEEFFLYHEDVDLSLRLRLRGGTLGVEPRARVDHDYSFEKGPEKWRHLERNRWATLIRTYPGPLLVLIAPALLLTELALLVVSAIGGWAPQKLGAIADTLASLPRLRRERRRIQAGRTVDAQSFAAALTPDLDSVYLGPAGRSPLLREALRRYWSLVLAALRRLGA